jgi:hypothetical protein
VTPIALNSSTVASNAISVGAITATSLTNSTFTTGSVLFAGASGLITQDNAQFFWDDTNHTLGLGTNTPQAASQITTVNSTGTSKPIWLFNYGTGSTTGIRGDAARGTVGSPTASQAGDTLNFMSGRGYGASQFGATSTASITMKAGAAFTNTSMPTYMAFSVTNVSSVTAAVAMTLNYTGNLLLGTTTDNGVDTLQLGTSLGLSANYVKFAGATSGYVEFIAPTAVTSYNLSLPAAQGSASSYLINDGAGNLTWTAGTPPAVSQNIDGGSSATLYTTPQLVNGGTP